MKMNTTQKTPKGNKDHQNIVSNIEAPRLQGVSTKDITFYLKERDLYEKQMEERNREPSAKYPLTSYKVSFDDFYLKNVLTAG